MNRFDIDFAHLPLSFGHRLRVIRETMDLKQAEVAESVGVSRSLISAFENERRQPTVEVVGRLAATLGLPRDELLGAVLSQRLGRSIDAGAAPPAGPGVAVRQRPWSNP